MSDEYIDKLSPEDYESCLKSLHFLKDNPVTVYTMYEHATDRWSRLMPNKKYLVCERTPKGYFCLSWVRPDKMLGEKTWRSTSRLFAYGHMFKNDLRTKEELAAAVITAERNITEEAGAREIMFDALSELDYTPEASLDLKVDTFAKQVANFPKAKFEVVVTMNERGGGTAKFMSMGMVTGTFSLIKRYKKEQMKAKIQALENKELALFSALNIVSGVLKLDCCKDSITYKKSSGDPSYPLLSIRGCNVTLYRHYANGGRERAYWQLIYNRKTRKLRVSMYGDGLSSFLPDVMRQSACAYTAFVAAAQNAGISIKLVREGVCPK